MSAASVKSLGITLDNRLSLDQYVTNVCKACYYHIRALRHVRDSLPGDVAKIVAVSIITSGLDYCNSLFVGMSANNFSKLQLPMQQRVYVKLPTITFNTIHIKEP